MKQLTIIFLFFLIGGCKDRFDLPLRPSDVSMLVVDGLLTAGDTTTITVSRSSKLGSAFQFLPELQSQLMVEGSDNSLQQLTETGNGRYSALLQLTVGNQYKLKISTKDGRQYESDFVNVKETPPIDSISWKRENDGVMIYASTHDPSNNTRYYKWDWVETWQYNSSFFQEYIYVEPNIVPIPPTLNTYSCWSTTRSTSILLGSSAQLQSDVIFENPIHHIPEGSEKISYRYSILVKQHSLEKTAYDYLQMMKKNTESLGSIFDAQPSELRGNIHCITNPAEAVIGYVSASSVSSQRIFILNSQVGWAYFLLCESFIVPNHPDSFKKHVPLYLPYTPEYSLTNPTIIVGYHFANNYCVDCRIRGGSNVKPSFW